MYTYFTLLGIVTAGVDSPQFPNPQLFMQKPVVLLHMIDPQHGELAIHIWSCDNSQRGGVGLKTGLFFITCFFVYS